LRPPPKPGTQPVPGWVPVATVILWIRNAEAPVYDREFFDPQRGSLGRSADVVVPIVLSRIPVMSVIDFGCGVGTWAAGFLRRGVSEVQGVDGDWVDRRWMLIPPECFTVADLTKPFRKGRRFELAVCLEAAEHLPESRGAGLAQVAGRPFGLCSVFRGSSRAGWHQSCE
jgi:2-polyprenyl-3-methyl-5-hydroxy-6-metoxy-1,4-benzoquinol methylase